MSDQPVRIVGSDRLAGGSTTIAFASVFTAVRLRTATREPVGFAFSIDVDLGETIGSARISTRIAAYRFRLVDASGQEILTYHWRPVGISPVRTPHVHGSGYVAALAGGPAIPNF